MRWYQAVAFQVPTFCGRHHKFPVVVAVELENPGAPSGKPVVIIAVEDDFGFGRKTKLRRQSLKLFLRNDVPPGIVHQIGMPFHICCPGNVALLIDTRLNAHFDNATFGFRDSSKATLWSRAGFFHWISPLERQLLPPALGVMLEHFHGLSCYVASLARCINRPASPLGGNIGK